MLEIVDSSGTPITVRVSFGQCFKAGAGVALGACLVGVFASGIGWVLGMKLLFIFRDALRASTLGQL